MPQQAREIRPKSLDRDTRRSGSAQRRNFAFGEVGAGQQTPREISQASLTARRQRGVEQRPASGATARRYDDLATRHRFPHLTPTLSAPGGGEGVFRRTCSELPSPPFRGEREGPRRVSDREGEVGR